MGLNVEDLLKTQDRVHVYGYGSLTWKPDFEYDDLFLGYIKGYSRRFWQGSAHHRGTPEKPGRVLTLTKAEQDQCWGIVFEIVGAEKIRKAIDYLQLREQSLGHYDIILLPVYPHKNSGRIQPVYSIVYYATPKNPLYLGHEGGLDRIANDIITSSGKTGHNIEYLFRLVDFMRECLPDENDHHLFDLNSVVRSKLGLGCDCTLPWKTLLTFKRFRSIVYCETEENQDLETSSPSTPVLSAFV